MTLLYIDLETRSTVDLRQATPYRYAADPQFDILMAAWAVDDGPVQVALSEAEIDAIPGLWDPTVKKVAHNAQFERVCLSRFNGLPIGRYIDPAEWHDTMAVAGEFGYPQSLGQLAKALGTADKDEAGTALINWFCKPDSRTGEFRRPELYPEKWEAFVRYCAQDVETLREIHKKLGGFPSRAERDLYRVDQAINDRGMAVDLEMAHAATEQAETNRMTDELEISALTGVTNPGSNNQLLGWLNSMPDTADMTNLRAETVEDALSRAKDPKVRQVLTLRQNLALVAAKKFPAALYAANEDGRLRGGFRFFGAHTGRWAGRGVQPHNMPREQFKTEAETEAAILDLKLGLGASAFDLKALVRALFTGPLTVVDYAAIEARVIAWLAGEEWALKAFEDGRDIYVETAGRMGTGYTRSQGKVAVLALGYNGGTNSLRNMGAEGTELQLQSLVTTWRGANPSIVNLWERLGTAFWSGGQVGEHLRVDRHGESRAIVLPSGRAIWYHGVKRSWETNQWGNQKPVLSFVDPKRGFRNKTYGGKLTENVTQAVARDVLGDALVRLHHAGYPVIGHVHDEILVEGRDFEGVRELMTVVPEWAPGLPIAAAGFTCDRYRKD